MEKILRLNKNFYKEKIIKKAISDFRGIAKIKMKKEKKYFVLFFSDFPKDFEKIIEKEFGNYVFCLSQIEK
jgi:hypothetical protein